MQPELHHTMMPTIKSLLSRRGTRGVIALATALVLAVGGAIAYVIVLASPAPPPPPTITAHPSSPTSSTNATFRFDDPGAPKDADNDHDTDPVLYMCSIDGSAYGSCTSPETYTGLHDGMHTFRVNAHEEGTGRSAPAAFTWAVSTTSPAITLAFPHSGSMYSNATWNAGCSTSGLCGSASDPAGVMQVQLSLQRQSNGRYWNGSSFSSSGQTFVSATLASAGSAVTAWRYHFPAAMFPADGRYTVNVRARDPLGHQTLAAHEVVATWKIDNSPPPPPTITSKPASSTTSTSATFAFTDGESGVTFRCSLDGAPYTACSSPTTYSNLSVQQHHFGVIACDAAANCSSAATYTWTVVVGTTSFGISGNAGAPFFPGGTAVSVDLIIANPFSSTLTVTSAQVTVAGTSMASCGASNFHVVQNLVGSVNIPANTTESLAAAGVPPSDWPMLQMLDTGSNQDVCQGATVHLTYAGSGTHP